MRISDWSSDVCSSDLHHPLRMPDIVLRDYPSHLHINLLPRLQGRGVGRRLIERWLRLAAAAGSIGVHLGVNAANQRASGFYRALGFAGISATVPAAPHAVWLARPLRTEEQTSALPSL